MEQTWQILTKYSVDFNDVIALKVEDENVLEEGHALGSEWQRNSFEI